MVGVVCAVFSAVVVRLVQVQALQAGRYAAYGVSERLRTEPIPALRGSITDRNGAVLAMSVALKTVVADPHQIKDPAAEAAQLAPVLGVDQATLQHQLSLNAGFVYLAHTVPQAVALQVSKLNLAGITEIDESKRFYPEANLLSPVIGTVGFGGQGLSGLEYQYNSRLNGKAGTVQVQVGAGGLPIPGTPEVRHPAVPGQNLELTLDRSLQYETQQALDAEVASSKASGGTAIIVNSKTGQILALANDAVTPDGKVVVAPSDSAVTQVYEPGSVMKGVTLSAALQTGAAQPSTHFTVPNSVQLDGSTIHDAETHPTEWWDLPDILAYSSNVGTLGISKLMGPDNIYHYMRAFGLGSPALGVAGESSGLLPPVSQWSGTSIATIPIGQGVAVTPMQMLDVYNTLANRGTFVSPSLVAGWSVPGGPTTAAPAPTRRTVVSNKTALQMTTMLEDVVRYGTGQKGAVAGYDVAGKTGTSQIPSPHGGYQAGAYVASFAGFAPAEDPAVTAIVVVKDPTAGDYFGADIAAPVFSTIVGYALRELRVVPPHPADLAPDVPEVDASAAAGGEGPVPDVNQPAQAVVAPGAPAGGPPAQATAPASSGHSTTGQTGAAAPPTTLSRSTLATRNP